MLAIAVELLTGRYVATEYNDRSRAEWPPHPARLFSAMVAAHYTSPTDAGVAALQWLEQQDPPEIACSEASEREWHTVFVPVNDKAADPERRARQPRTFPSLTPESPRIVFVWPSANPSTEVKAALDAVAAKVVRLGHSSSLVSVHLAEMSPEPSWRPSARGNVRLRVTAPGQLQALDERFALHQEVEPRVMPARFQIYARERQAPVADAHRTVFGDDWIVLRRARARERSSPGPTIPMTATAGLARVVRRALMKFLPSSVPEIISGHKGDGAPSETPHMAVVPLPVVGGERPDGSIIGVALIPPRDCAEADRHAIYAALGAWEASARGDREDEIPPIPVHLGRAGILELVRLDDPDDSGTPYALRPLSWCRPARRWMSATPVALDRNPGELWSRDDERRSLAHAEARESITLACSRIGLPSPASVELLPAAPLAGSAKARRYPPFPEGDGRVQRVLVHVALEFEQKVTGPVLIGAGRYHGLGLFRPVQDE